MMKSLKIGSLVVMALMLLFVRANAQTGAEKVKIGDTMPQFTLNSEVYGTVTPADLKGKVVLVSLFATWCGPCQKELAEVQTTLYPKYKDNENFRLLVIGREHTDAELTNTTPARSLLSRFIRIRSVKFFHCLPTKVFLAPIYSIRKEN